MGPARWERAGDEPIELDAQGRVFEGSTLTFVVDRAGRVFDDDSDPVALLSPEGRLVGPSSSFLGRVGVTNAAPPHRDVAWLSVLPDGNVLYFNEDGDRSTDGRWSGCEGALHRTCTLITHLIASRSSRGGMPRVGVGIGMTVPL
jgi:hypothetical protein